MSFEVFGKTETCRIELVEDTLSRDSGISMDQSSSVQENYNFSNGLNTHYASKNVKGCFNLDEGMEELIIDERTNDNTEPETFATSCIKLRKGGLTGKVNNSLKEVTNRIALDDSPKTHLPTFKRLHDFNFKVYRRPNRRGSVFDNNIARKRILETTPCDTKRKRESFDEKENMTYENNENHNPVSRNICIPHSSSTVGFDEFSKNRSGDLPQLLHVEYSLKTVVKPQIESVAFKSISGDVIAQLMLSMSEEEFAKKYVLIDCRYPFEYAGGHLRGAINMFELSRVNEVFYPDSPTRFRDILSKIPIFYCEYSQKRGPRMAAALRQEDRRRNEDRYPEVDYKEIYLLDRGYKKFFEEDQYIQLCEPPAYTKMTASPHKEDLKRYQLHRCKSSTALYGNLRSVASRRDLLVKGKPRFSQSVDESPTAADHTTLEMPSSATSPSGNPRRGNLFGSPMLTNFSPPFRQQKLPIPFAKFS